VAVSQRRAAVTLRDVAVERGRDQHRVLDGLDLMLAPGERMVVTGPSGAGKTTLAHLLVRFLERVRGDARLGPHDLREHAQEDVRGAVLLSGQEPHIFNSSIRANLVFARLGASDGEVHEALTRAGLHEWVTSLPSGLDTLVGERGRSLSGGQRQRLALARAFLADPAVLILDEPTAHLDTATATALLAHLWERAGDRSVLLITHGDVGPFDGCQRVELPMAESSTGDDAMAQCDPVRRRQV
jgi:ABC-type multidrug transport system fused ATPase/permease subunit